MAPLSALLLCFLSAAPAGELPCRVSFVPPGSTTEGSGYTALEVGKDGTVYVGTARYGDYAKLLAMDPKTLVMREVADLQTLTGERLTGINPQGKIHTKIVVAADGKVYFGSKQAHEIFGTRPEYGEAPDGYPGGYLCVYDPATKQARSLGILMKQEGLMAGVIDDARARLYYLSFPRDHFLSYDIKTGRTRDHGHTGSHARYNVVTPPKPPLGKGGMGETPPLGKGGMGGVVWTTGRDKTLIRFDPEKDLLETLPVKLVGEGAYREPYCLVISRDGKTLWGLIGGHESIMEFDLAGATDTVSVRNVAPAAPEGFVNADIHAAVLGKDDMLYYPCLAAGKPGRAGKNAAAIHMMRFDPKTRAVTDLGVPKPTNVDDEREKANYVRGQPIYKIDHIQGAAVADDGTLYLLDIYPQLNVVAFPKLTAASKEEEKGRRGEGEKGRRGEGEKEAKREAQGLQPVGLVGLDRFDAWTRHNVVADESGALGLAPTEMITDENGATTIQNRETLSAKVWAKKVLLLDRVVEAKNPTLYVFGSAKAVMFNGKPLPEGKRHLTTGWYAYAVPKELLKDGLNEVVLSGGGSLLVENCRHPNRSAKSRDGGATWDFDHLGDDDFNDGEYLVRLRLDRPPETGWAISPAMPLSGRSRLSASAQSATAEFRFNALRDGSLPIREFRTSSDAAAWSAWSAVGSGGALSFERGARLVQFRVRWTGAPTKFLSVDLRLPEPQAGAAVENTSPAILRPSEPFAYEKFGPRLTELRRKHNLDAVVSGAKDEMDAFVKLRHHVRNKWDNGWEVSPGGYCAPWDARQILAGQPLAECLTMCTHYSVVFSHFAMALGHTARPVILDHHCVAEIWSNQFGKWVMMDTGNTKKSRDLSMHLSKDGIPLSCLDIHKVAVSGDTAGVTLHFGDGKTDALANLKNYPVCQLDNWRRFAVPRRNNFLTTPFPGELEQGWSQYFHDGYIWWEDGPVPAWSAEYSRQSHRPGDLYPTLNTTAIHPFADGENDVAVVLETQTPNFKTFQVRNAADAPWRDSPASVKMDPRKAHVLFARSVNQFGVAGPESKFEIRR